MPEPSQVGNRARADRILDRLRGALHPPEPISRRRRAAQIGIVAMLLLGPFVSHLHKAFHPKRPHGDWYSIYAIGRYSIDTGKLQADENDPIVRTQRYPPITRPMLMLLAAAPKAIAAVLSFALFVTLYFWSADRVSRFFFSPAPAARWAGAVLALALAVPYVWADLTAGNLTSVLLASATGAFVLAERNRPLRAGVVLSIGIMLKIIPILCLLYFVVRRKWRVAWGAALGVLLFGLLPSLFLFGPDQLWDYHGYWYQTQFLEYTPMNTIDHPTEYSYQNQSVVRTMVRLFTDVNAGSSARPFRITITELPRTTLKAMYTAIMAATGLALLGCLWRTRRAETPTARAVSYSLCVGAMLWFTPWVGSYYFSLAVWPAAALLGCLLSGGCKPDRTPWATAALGLWLCAMPAIASRFLRALSVHTGCAALLLVALAAAYPFATNAVTANRPDRLG
ncbi:MAG: glycosyltransferase family 87 protein [Phycisphaerae bacterium]